MEISWPLRSKFMKCSINALFQPRNKQVLVTGQRTIPLMLIQKVRMQFLYSRNGVKKKKRIIIIAFLLSATYKKKEKK